MRAVRALCAGAAAFGLLAFLALPRPGEARGTLIAVVVAVNVFFVVLLGGEAG